jgi:Zn-dependent M28 family amino/carboxypeptidase
MESNEANLISTVRYLSEEIGARSYRDLLRLNKAADYIENALHSYGCIVSRQAFTYDGITYYNVIGEVKGTNPDKREILIIGAHYDTVIGTPGADDNASGVAALLEVARMAALSPAERTIRFAAFSLEEPPAFGTDKMGSYSYARQVAEEGVKVYGMIALEMLGYFCEDMGCQEYPPGVGWLFPDKGNFISFVGNLSSRSFTKQVKKTFSKASDFPIETLNTFSSITGVDFSDHRNFWKFGFNAFMITDTSFYRNHNYHMPDDTWEKLDFRKINQLVTGLYRAVGVL